MDARSRQANTGQVNIGLCRRISRGFKSSSGRAHADRQAGLLA
jgi:hypothetical protein